MNNKIIPDTLYLWWLSRPDTPVLIGELRLTRVSNGVSLRYSDNWLRNGFSLSEDLPLKDIDYIPTEKETAVGAVDDARPDRWGERVIRFLDKPARLSVLDYLFYAGDDRFGALGVSMSKSLYVPKESGLLPKFENIDDIHKVIGKVLANNFVTDSEKRLIAPGVTLGGAKPKALVDIDGGQWIVKFSEADAMFNEPLVEHAAMTLAKQCGIHVAQTMPIELENGSYALAVKRFDRRRGKRVHAQSARVIMMAAGYKEFGYPPIAQILRRIGINQLEQRNELFKRMVFNILIDNTDDHEKNHAFLMTDTGHISLSPAYDVLPTGQSLGYQQMIIGRDGFNSTIDNALSMTSQFGLSLTQAKSIVFHVASVVDKWQKHFSDVGVSKADIKILSGSIDREFLLSQRTIGQQGSNLKLSKSTESISVVPVSDFEKLHVPVSDNSP